MGIKRWGAAASEGERRGCGGDVADARRGRFRAVFPRMQGERAVSSGGGAWLMRRVGRRLGGTGLRDTITTDLSKIWERC